jgi:luciferase-like monooxygenase
VARSPSPATTTRCVSSGSASNSATADPRSSSAPWAGKCSGWRAVYANVHVGVGDRAAALPRARYDLFSYAVVDAYAASFTQAGFGDAVQAIRDAHRAGDRAGALAAVPEQMADATNVTGDQELVAATIGAYRRAGVDVPVIFPLTWGAAGPDALEATLQAAMAPTAPDAGGSWPAPGLAGTRRRQR